MCLVVNTELDKTPHINHGENETAYKLICKSSTIVMLSCIPRLSSIRSGSSSHMHDSFWKVVYFNRKTIISDFLYKLLDRETLFSHYHP